MSLRSKLVAILSILVGLFTLSQFVIQRVVLYPSFQELENRQARQDLQRVIEALQNDIRHLDGLCHDWSSWDDTYDFVVSRDPAYVEGNLGQTALTNNRLSVLYIVGIDGDVAARILPEPGPDEAQLELPEFPTDQRSPEDPLHCVKDVRASIKGVFVTKAGPMLIAVRPILSSSDEGPVRGSLLMGRLLDAKQILAVASQIKVNFTLECLPPDAIMDVSIARILQQLEHTPGGIVTMVDETTSETTGIEHDFRGRPAVVVRARAPRDVTLEGGTALRFAILSMTASALLTLLVVLLLVQRVVVEPLTNLTSHTVAIGRNGDFAARVRSVRKDEIGVLSGEFDSMMEKLECSRTQLVASAHTAGMSEVATNVLHDVGNALNSVNVSAEVVRRKLGSLPVADLERMSAQMRAHSDDLGAFLTKDPKGKQYPDYLALMARHLEDERLALVAETGSLSEGLDHIKVLVQSQQSLAGNSEAYDLVGPAEELEAALRISGAGAGGTVEIVRELGGPPAFRVQRHRLLQILVNLLRNAREAVDASGSTAKRITLRVCVADDGRQLRFEVEDNGVGIAPEATLAVFTRGFTTKKGSHGFGLHSAANTALDMHGGLCVESAGIGRGAKFVLELPLRQEAVAAL